MANMPRARSAAGTPAAAKAPVAAEAKAGPKLMPSVIAALTRPSARVDCSRVTRSVEAACASARLAAKAPASSRAATTPLYELERAVSALDATEPHMHSKSTGERPNLCESFTRSGAKTICIAEKPLTTRAAPTVLAPKESKCSGSVEIVTPTPSDCTKMNSQIGISLARGRGSSSGCAVLALSSNECLVAARRGNVTDRRGSAGVLPYLGGDSAGSVSASGINNKVITMNFAVATRLSDGESHARLGRRLVPADHRDRGRRRKRRPSAPNTNFTSSHVISPRSRPVVGKFHSR